MLFASLLMVGIQANRGLCRVPQRTGIFSLDALSNRDQITNVFHDITSQLKKLNASTTISGQQYQIQNLTASLYYNDGEQNETIEGTHC